MGLEVVQGLVLILKGLDCLISLIYTISNHSVIALLPNKEKV